MTRDRIEQWFWRAAWILVLATALGLRLYGLDGPAPWEDDYLNLDRAMLPLRDLLAIQQWQGPADTIFDFQPPLSYALVHLALWFDSSTLAARLPSLVAGVLTVAGLGLLGTRLLGRGAGLCAAALAAGLVFPIAFAQAIKAYSLLLCLSVFAMWLLVRALDRNSWPAWAGYALCAAAMVYAGYQGLVVFVVQAVWAGLAGWAMERRQPGTGRARLWPGLAAFGGVVLAIWPLLPAVVFLRDFLHAPGVDPWQGVDMAFAVRVLSGFIGYDDGPLPWFAAVWAGAAALGLTVAVRRGRLGAALLLLGWAGGSTLALIASKSALRPILDSRHLIMAFPALVLLAGLGLVWLATAAGQRLPAGRVRRAAPAVLAGLAGLGLLWPSLSRYDAYYGRVLSFDRDFYQWLDQGPGDVAAVEFHGYKRNTRRMALRWMLPGRFGEAGTFAAPGYRIRDDVDTFYTTQAASRPALPGWPVAVFTNMFATTRVSRVAQASRAPVVMDPGEDGTWRYDDDFATQRFYADAFAADNMTLDGDLGQLRPSRYSRPASVAWVFETPQGMALAGGRLTVTAALFKKSRLRPADSRLTVEAAGDDGRFIPLGVISHDAFFEPGTGAKEIRPGFFEEMDFYDGRCRVVPVTYELPAALAGAGRLTVRLNYLPGQAEGFLGLDALALEARLVPGDKAGEPLVPVLARQAEHWLANVGAVPWPQDGARDSGRYAFVAPDAPAGDVLAGLAGVSPAEALPGFLAAHPGLAPAAALADASGRAALLLYDPSLANPGLALSAAAPAGQARLAGPPPGQEAEPVSLRLDGRIAMPTLAIDGQQLAVPVLAPAGSRLTLTPGGAGRLFFAPDWTGADLGRGAMSYANDIAPSPRRRGGLVCVADAGCALAYTFASALPMTELRLRVYPTVYANPCRKCEPNAARVRLSTDGGATYRTILADGGGEACTWSPDGHALIRRVTFDRPVTSALLILEMGQGDQAGFLAPSWNVDAMFVEIDLDARQLPPVSLSGPQAAVSLIDGGENDLAVFVRSGPWPISHRTDPALSIFTPRSLIR
ncbi:glycosyltransferase family 39 protein [Desulfovibrio sp. TomC]|uniref:glycosyltransferase family 39 protein n=1 Tax=Desulfovibrio sp. TomC TaxID=1562888 RepID=UPI0005BC18A6|nr:glycosyltransferase family 39 protein [Desulfovibrio sp. TomC]